MEQTLAALFAQFIEAGKTELEWQPSTVLTWQSNCRAFHKWLIETGSIETPTLAHFDTDTLRRYVTASTRRGLRPRTVKGLMAPPRPHQ